MLFENVELGATPGGAESGYGVVETDGLEAQDIGRALDDVIVERIAAAARPVDAAMRSTKTSSRARPKSCASSPSVTTTP